MNPVITVDNVSFRYNDVPVLEKVSLAVEQGEFLGIVGPNGGGKSTLLKLILGLLKPLQGAITVLGAPPEQACRQLGYVPQFVYFDRHFPITVRDTVLQGRLGKTRPLLGYSRQDRKRAVAAMGETDILDLAQRPIAALSGGQLQRVLIARALACDPEILLLDEPTANIDPKVEEDVFDLLKRLNEKITIIVVSHDIGFISNYITRVACLNRTLVCHTTSPISGGLLEKLYGSPIRMVHHETRLSARIKENGDDHEQLP
ncbi:MAG: ABC transporter ATP-binding protein [Desulfuromonadaceae bacterium]|nr:ABC transporter ATP-binding protein [Desulfuromonadaceae bacterium]